MKKLWKILATIGAVAPIVYALLNVTSISGLFNVFKSAAPVTPESAVGTLIDKFRGIGEQRTEILEDKSFAPTAHRGYDPSPILPGLTNRGGGPPDLRLPAGVSELDVKRVVSLKVKDFEKEITMIELRSGEVMVARDLGIEKVTDWKYKPSLLFGLYAGIGVTADFFGNGSIRFSPAAKVSFLELWEFLRLPAVAADLDGAGVGMDVRLYHSIFVSPVYLWMYSDPSRTMIKAMITYNF